MRAAASHRAESEERGRLIAICGIDGSGKTTQTALLAQRAEDEGWTVRGISFPRYGQGFFADLIERYLRGEFSARAAEVSPYLAALPYACDRWEAASQLRKWLADRCLVLCNRYVPANLAHQGSKIVDETERRAFFRWVEELEYGVFDLPRPDLHILLEMDPAQAVELLANRSRTDAPANAEDIHEGDISHLEATARTYRELAGDPSSPWAVVRCCEGESLRPPEEIAESVWDAVRKILYNDA